MAKCIQVVGQGIPVRLSDDDAFQVVERDHDGQYCSKKLFKHYYTPAVEGATYTPFMAKLQNGSFHPVATLSRQLQHSRKTW